MCIMNKKCIIFTKISFKETRGPILFQLTVFVEHLDEHNGKL